MTFSFPPAPAGWGVGERALVPFRRTKLTVERDPSWGPTRWQVEAEVVLDGLVWPLLARLMLTHSRWLVTLFAGMAIYRGEAVLTEVVQDVGPVTLRLVGVAEPEVYLRRIEPIRRARPKRKRRKR